MRLWYGSLLSWMEFVENVKIQIFPLSTFDMFVEKFMHSLDCPLPLYYHWGLITTSSLFLNYLLQHFGAKDLCPNPRKGQHAITGPHHLCSGLLPRKSQNYTEKLATKCLYFARLSILLMHRCPVVLVLKKNNSKAFSHVIV